MITSKLPNDIVAQVSEEFNIPADIVRSAYKGYWKFIRDFIASRNIDEDGAHDEYSDVYIPHIGRFNVKLKRQYRDDE